MKNTYLFTTLSLFLSILFVSCSPVPLIDFDNYDDTIGKLVYEEVVQVEGDGNSSDQIYEKLYKWIVMNYVSPDDIIHLNDRKNYKLIVKGKIKTDVNFQSGVMNGWYSHILELEIKDGRYKYIITIHSYDEGSGPKTIWNFIGGIEIPLTDDNDLPSSFNKWRNMLFKDVDNRVKSLISSMKESVNVTKLNQNDDW